MKVESLSARNSYRDSDTETKIDTSLSPGAVKISPERQQLIGVKIGTVDKKTASHTIRILGRVSVDETRIYRINATVDGWVTKALPNSAGTFVKKNETLATFYSPSSFPQSRPCFLV